MPSPVRTLHLTNAWHPASGGIRTFYAALLDAAAEQERTMRLVVPGAETRVELVNQFAAIHHVEAAPAPSFDRRYRLLRPRHYLTRRSPIAAILASERPDLVEVCDKYTLWPLGRLLRAGHYGARPSVVGLSCERMDDNVTAYVSPHPVARRLSRTYLHRVYGPSFDAHLANSAYTADELIQHAGVADVAICPMGVDVDCFGSASPDPSRRHALLVAAGGGPSSVLVLYAGRVSPEKHLDVLVDAVGLLTDRLGGPDIRLVVAGTGPAVGDLVARAADRAPGRVHFLGQVADRRALATLYASADVFAHPNAREPFGIGPLEAMAAGVPVVLARGGGVLSYAHDGNAWLSAAQATPFAEALVAAAARGRTSSRITAARETARAHAWPVIARRYFATLDRLHTAGLTRAAGLVPVLAPPAPRA